MCPFGKVVSRILCLNANLSRTPVAWRLKRGMPRPNLDPYGRRHHSPCTARGLPAIRTLPYGPIRSLATSDGFSRFGRSPVWSLWHFPYPALMCWPPGRRRYLPRFPGSVRTFLTRVAPGVRVPPSERAGALYGNGAKSQMRAFSLIALHWQSYKMRQIYGIYTNPMESRTFRKSIVAATGFFGTLAALSVGYAALSGGITASDKVSSNAPLSSASWNRVVDGILDLDARTNGISSMNGNIGIGVANPGKTLDIQGSLRISSGHIITNNPNGGIVLNA